MYHVTVTVHGLVTCMAEVRSLPDARVELARLVGECQDVRPVEGNPDDVVARYPDDARSMRISITERA